METPELEKLKYPIGKFTRPVNIMPEDISTWIVTIAEFPGKVIKLVEPLSEEQLNLTYRPDGWTIKQVVHHCADSHMNSQMRFKLALTENIPTIKPYLEARWAELLDLESPVGWSLQLLEALHKKWVFLLKGLSNNDLKKTYFHPEQKREIPLDETIALYAWHCQHHLGHIALALQNKPA